MLSAPAWIVIIVVAVLSTFFLIATIAMLLTHLRELATSIASIRDDLAPSLDRLSAQAEVMRTELEQVQDASQRLGDERDERRDPARRAQGTSTADASSNG